MIHFQKDKSIAEFADQFYLEAQVLTDFGSLTVHDAHIALCSVVKLYKALYCILMPEFQDNCSIDGMVQYLCQCGDTFGPPNALVNPRPLLTPPACTEGSGHFAPKAICPRLLATAVIARGTMPTPALLKQVFMYCPLRTLLSREKTKWSRYRTLSLHFGQPHQCPHCSA
ncbi:hypothetical protein DSO57_1008148 [Entomophthora muscae]|uniref:Uncharacterized protein n=1 Tax=Entomophthora muscae TaxID=34485 RepID=A0ACC2SK97_9FUNG|nr:hypothetical protein DSO57_1008148 [Entomophthora muscae]